MSQALHSGRWAWLTALAFYGVWTAATWLLEGRTLVLLRPEAVGERIVYVVIANLLIGTFAALWLHTKLQGDASAQTPRRRALALGGGFLAGAGLYVAQGAPTLDPIVVLNGFLQVLPVSTAEVLVCWLVLGSQIQVRIARFGPRWGNMAGALVSSVAFGLYHIAHSPPFDSWGMIALLTGVGLLTSLFYALSRDIFGAIVFHNFLALYGVLQALIAAGHEATFETLQWPLLFMAIVSLMVLTIGMCFFRRRVA